MKNSIRRACSTGVIAMLALGGITLWNPSTVKAATHVSYAQKQIVVNGKTVSRPDGFVANHTTYVPIWYVMNLLKSFSITSTWNSGVWSLRTPSSMVVSPKELTTGTGQSAIRLNGKTIARVPTFVDVDPASGRNTTFMPIWYVMQLLDELGYTNGWNGTTWTISTAAAAQSFSQGQATGLANQASSDTTVAPTTSVTIDHDVTLPHPTYADFTPAIHQLTHVAKDDSAYYSRASDSMYISAQTTNPLSSNKSTESMDDIQTGQTVYLYTWSDSGKDSMQNVEWMVNSDNATLTPDTRHIWSLVAADGSKTSAGEAAFVATKPGVYTVQAKAPDGIYSVPITIIVGMSQFKSAVSSIASYTGVAPFTPTSAEQPKTSLSNQTGTSVDVYAPTSDGWIPLSGNTVIGATEIEVTFGANPAEPTWSYAIPVNADGSFSALVRSPVSGSNVTMTFFTKYVEDMTAWGNGENTVDSPLTDHLSVTALAPSSSELDLFSSAKMNYNLNPTFASVAATLYQQAGSTDSGIEAINAFVADDIAYDTNELKPNQYRFQNSTTTWSTKSGVCEDDAELEASMLKAIGIPTETIQGVAQAATQTVDPIGSNGDNHEWVKVFDGTQWLLADPTWSGPGDGTTGWETSEFFTSTKAFASTHTADNGATGTPA